MSGDLFDIIQGNRETVTGTLHDPAATTGHVLTVQADKSIAAAPGGGSVAVMAFYTAGSNTTINDGSFAYLPFGALGGGSELLDHTTPDHPTVLADGTYALSGQVYSTAPLTANGFIVATTLLSPITLGSNLENEGQGSTPDSFGVGAPMVIGVLAAGDGLGIFVSNLDGVSARDFNLVAQIVKLA